LRWRVWVSWLVASRCVLGRADLGVGVGGGVLVIAGLALGWLRSEPRYDHGRAKTPIRV
jgi:hypothetical protein